MYAQINLCVIKLINTSKRWIENTCSLDAAVFHSGQRSSCGCNERPSYLSYSFTCVCTYVCTAWLFAVAGLEGDLRTLVSDPVSILKS